MEKQNQKKLNKAINIGLKLYTTDTELISEARKLYKNELFHFIELYVLPDISKEIIKQWEKLDIPFIFHAAHSTHGINLAQAGKEKENRKYFSELQRFADFFNVKWIIVHGGNNGSILETIRQIGLINDSRIIIENKPKIGLDDQVCIGWSPIDFQQIANAGKLNGFVLDFIHASCAAFSDGIDEKRMIEKLLRFNPLVFHLSDGNKSSEKDAHINLGKGNCDLSYYISCIPSGGFVTLETPRKPLTGLEDFKRDVKFFLEHI